MPLLYMPGMQMSRSGRGPSVARLRCIQSVEGYVEVKLPVAPERVKQTSPSWAKPRSMAEPAGLPSVVRLVRMI